MPQAGEQQPTRLAIIGGGHRCYTVIRLLDSQKLKRMRAEIAGVADIDPEAVGIIEARRRGIFTTSDYRSLLNIKGLDLVIELTGDERLLHDLAKRKPKSVELIDYTASSLFHDIAHFGQELEKIEDQINLERSFAAALTRAASEGVLVLDENFRILRINQAACKWADLTPRQARGRFCYQVLRNFSNPCRSPNTPCPMLQTLSTGKSAHFIHEFRDTSGEAHFCEVSTYPLVNKQGKMVQVLEVFRDITNELAERVENRTRAIKKDLSRLVQEDKLLSLGKLVASVAHEINNPLASIINFSKLILSYLQEGPPDADQAKQWAQWLGMIQAEAERSSRIVANLLSFAREQPLEPKLIDLRELMDQIVLLTAHRMEISQVDPDYQRPAYPLWAMGDPTQIQQCFANLVFNSLEAMPEGGRLTIKGGLGPGAKVWFEVRDTGIGMDPELLPRIFEPFFSTKQQGKGVGLGLSMVYGIISEHRGRIDVDTVPDEGSTFRITLPKASQKGGKGR